MDHKARQAREASYDCFRELQLLILIANAKSEPDCLCSLCNALRAVQRLTLITLHPTATWQPQMPVSTAREGSFCLLCLLCLLCFLCLSTTNTSLMQCSVPWFVQCHRRLGCWPNDQRQLYARSRREQTVGEANLLSVDGGGGGGGTSGVSGLVGHHDDGFMRVNLPCAWQW